MLRMFKVTSPMSVGSWVLAGVRRDRHGGRGRTRCSACCRRAGARSRRSRPRCSGCRSRTYTAALVANTAVPVWHEARRELPFVFAAARRRARAAR